MFYNYTEWRSLQLELLNQFFDRRSTEETLNLYRILIYKDLKFPIWNSIMELWYVYETKRSSKTSDYNRR